MTILFPMILDAARAVGEVRKQLESDTDSAWAVLRVERGLEIEWYLLNPSSVRTQIADAADDVLLGPALGLVGHKPIPTVQLAALDADSTEAPCLVLDGRRVFGLIEPLVKSGPPPRSTRGPKRGTRSPGARTSADATSQREAVPGAPRGGLLGTGAKPPPQPTIAESRQLDAAAYVNAPASVRAGAKFTLEIGLAAKAVKGVAGGKVRVTFPTGVAKLPLDVEVVAPDFTSAKGWRHTLEIPRDDPFTPRLKLSLVPPQLPSGVASRSHAITVHYSHAGAHCGTAVRRLVVHDGAAPATGMQRVPEPEPTVHVDSTAPAIDLTVRIAWRDDNEATNILDWTFATPHDLPLPAGALSKVVAEGGAAFARRLLTDVTQHDGSDGIELLLDGIGGEIADAIPEGFWPVLRAVARAARDARGAEAIPTLLLLTQETQIPWELAAVPEPVLDSSRAAFLATQCVVARWVLDSATASPVPPARLDMTGLAVIVGDYPEGGYWAPLPNAQIESKELCARYQASSLTATLQNVLGVLKCELPASPNGGVSAIHFACHGEVGRADAAASAVILNDGSPISPTFFRKAPIASKNHPLVFLNACQVGAAGTTLGQYGGFAGICVRAGCSAVIAPLWSVNDVVARDLALAFYDRVLGKGLAAGQRTSVAAAVHALRQPHLATITVKVPQPDGSEIEEQRPSATPLAYVVYGHPGLVLEQR